MKLVDFRVEKFRNFIDSTTVSVEDDVTCLVGKNESGKTALLQALLGLRPARPAFSFHIHEHYPAWLEKRDRLRGEELEKVMPIRATFALEAEDLAAVEDTFGKGVLKLKRISLMRDYAGKTWFTIEVDEAAALKTFLASVSLPKEIAQRAKKAKDFESLRGFAEDLKGATQNPNDADASASPEKAGQVLEEGIAQLLGEGPLDKAVYGVVKPRIPQFFYFHEYSRLPYSVDIESILKADPKDLDDDKLTARALLRLAGAQDEYLLNPDDYERRKRELENVANALTADVLKYWTQNPELRVQPDISQKTVSNPQGKQSVLDELKVRIWDERHQLSLPFDQHSSGFQWFFSFLAAFSEYEHASTPVVILLDEPALGLHAKAQADFLKFIEERLASRCQVIYTTHSPFMVQPGRLDRVRLVEDKGRTDGAKVSQDVLSSDRDTLFPLQGALGYELAQHLFIAPHNLVVEGTSDFAYLTLISDYLRDEAGLECLDARWSIVPVGGADLIPTFVALLGQHLDVTVLVDARKKGNQRLSQLAKGGYLTEKRIITIGQVLEVPEADIEDLFGDDEYLELYNTAFGTKISAADIAGADRGSDRILKRIERHQDVKFSEHGRLADVLLRNRAELLPKLSKETLGRFEKLFHLINATLPAG